MHEHAETLPRSTYCPACGYDLCGLRGSGIVCPECGGAHPAAALLDPVAAAARVRQIGRSITVLALLLWCGFGSALGAVLAGKWQICALTTIQFSLTALLVCWYGPFKLHAALPRRQDRRLVLTAATLLFVRQFLWFVAPLAGPGVLFYEWPPNDRTFWVAVVLLFVFAGLALLDALTFGVIPERRTRYHRIRNQLKHRAGDRSIPPDESK
ncbi:MAG: hypothetical protein ACKVS9_05550 [Phycisphaerae bacterium]